MFFINYFNLKIEVLSELIVNNEGMGKKMERVQMMENY